MLSIEYQIPHCFPMQISLFLVMFHAGPPMLYRVSRIKGTTTVFINNINRSRPTRYVPSAVRWLSYKIEILMTTSCHHPSIIFKLLYTKMHYISTCVSLTPKTLVSNNSSLLSHQIYRVDGLTI